MCTLVILRRPGSDWPVLMAANRDELRSRAARPPARHWPDYPEVVGGLDVVGGGSWLGINDHGLIAAVLNREGTLGPLPGKRSRGELVLEALDHAEARAAAGALADLAPSAYRPFNLVVADPREAWWLRHGGDGEVRLHRIADGLHLLAGTELDDPTHPRLRAFLPRFRAATVPVPTQPTTAAAAAAPPPGWADWIALLGERSPVAADASAAAPAAAPDAAPEAAMAFSVARDGDWFETRSSDLIALPAYPGFEQRPRWWHAAGPPGRAGFVAVDLALPGRPDDASLPWAADAGEP